MSQGGFRKPAQPDTARPDVAGKAKPEDGKAEKRRTETAGNGRRKALVVPDYEQADTEGVDKSELAQIMQNNLKELNAQLAAYEQVSDITIYPTEFEKTPKRSIKRYLYAPSLLNK